MSTLRLSACPYKLSLASPWELERNDPFEQERHLPHYSQIELGTPHTSHAGHRRRGRAELVCAGEDVFKHINRP